MNFSFPFFWRLFLRRLPAMLALFLLCVGLSVAMAFRLPEIYQTSARLLVEAPQITDELITTTVELDAAEQLQIIEQKLLTRANLIDIANELNVFEDIGDMNPDEVVKAMEAATVIRSTSGRNQATLMSISFEGRSAQIVADVVNEYVTKVLDENARLRGGRARDTLAFFEQQVEELGQELDEQSARIVAFKNANRDALPDDLEYRLGRQSLLQERQARLERERDALVNQREQMVTIFEATGQIEQDRSRRLSPAEEQLQLTRQQLADARLVYSETNPRVVRLAARIEQLEKTVAAQALPEGMESESLQNASLLDVTLVETDARISSMTKEIADTIKELEDLNDSINATPANGIALGALERDYANTQLLYNGAVSNLNKARLGEQIEVERKGERIELLEAASIPSEPSGPERVKIMVAGIVAGLGLAGGLFMLLELLNRSIRRPAELTNKFGVTPLTVIPYMETRRSQLMRRAALVGAFLLVLLGVPAGLWAIDTFYLPLELVATRIFDQLGLS